MLRQIQSVLIVAFFGTMMFFLVRDHVIPSLGRPAGIEVDRSVLADTWVDQDEWLVVKLGDSPLGSLRTSAEAERAEPVVTTRRSGLSDQMAESYTTAAHLELAQGLLNGRLLTVATLNRRLELETVRLRAYLAPFGKEAMTGEQLDAEDLPAGAYELVGRVEGSEFLYRLRRDGAVQYGSFRLPRPVTVADSIAPVLRGNMLTKDVVYTVDMFDPLMGNKAGGAEIEWVDSKRQQINGEWESLRIVEMRYQGMKSRLTVDPNGTVLRREIPLFAANTGNTSLANDAKGASVVFERVAPDVARDKMPALQYLPTPRPVLPSDVRGTDTGEVIQGLSAFAMMGGSVPNALKDLKGEN
ncbi:hypothetical protein GC173_03920 [bacterium]|nr:hypothetical protein [bacterium]